MSVGQSITIKEASESQATDETEEFEFSFASLSILTKTCVSACRPSDEFVSNALRLCPQCFGYVFLLRQ